MPNPFVGNTPRTAFGATGLGAIGGARGVGAFTFRILAEFVTQYDAGQIEGLAKQLDKIDKDREANLQKQEQLQQQLTQSQAKLLDAEQAKRVAGREASESLKKIQQDQLLIQRNEEKIVALRQAHQGGITKIREENSKLTKDIGVQLDDLKKQGILTDDQINILLRQNAIKAEQRGLQQQINGLTAQDRELEQQRNAVMAEGNRIQAARSQLLPRLGAVGIGLVGGTIGGALAGALLLDPLQKALDAVGEGVQNILDPARHAREEVEDLGKAVHDIGSEENLSGLQAAAKYIDEIAHNAATDPKLLAGLDPQALAIAEMTTRAKDLAEAWGKIIDQQDHGQRLLDEQVASLIKLKIQTDASSGSIKLLPLGIADFDEKLHAGRNILTDTLDTTAQLGIEQQYVNGRVIDWQYYLDLVNSALGNTNNLLGDTADKAAEAASQFQSWLDEFSSNQVSAVFDKNIENISSKWDATIQGMRDALDTAIEYRRNALDKEINTIQEIAQNRIDALQRRASNLEVVPSARTKSLERQLEALKDAGPSRQTKELADQIERINAATEKQAYLASLREVHEERALIILKERLRLSTGEINIDDYQGKKRLVAIDALIEREQKRSQLAQQFNEYLKIQYELGQAIRREQGETIQEYLGRVAQRNRDLMNQLGQSASERRTSALEEAKRDTQYQLDLKESLEKEKQLIEERASKLRMQRLQDELQASKEHDQKILESTRNRLQKQLEASKKADQAALDAKRQAIQDEITAVRKGADAQITAARNRADEDIKNSTRSTDARIADAERQKQAEIDAEKERKRQMLLYTSTGETERNRILIQNAQNIEQISALAGAASGSEFEYQQLLAQIKALGLSTTETQILLKNAASLRDAALRRLNQFKLPTITPTGPVYQPREGGYAQGGIFPITNGTWLGNNMRGGEEGTELGVILSNKVVKALERNTGSGRPSMTIQEMNINRSDDPYRDRYMFRREIEKVVRELLH